MALDGSLSQDKVAIVTGSGRGLGLAYAAELARRVPPSSSTTSTRRPPRTPSRPSRPPVAGPSRSSLPVGSTETAKALVAAAVDNFGRLDILVTNAGVLRDTVLWKMSDDDFDTVIDVHLRGTFTVRPRSGDRTCASRTRSRPDHLHRLADRPARQLRPDQLRRRQGRHRRHGAHVGARAQARRHHRQRRHPRRRDRDDGDRPVLRRGRRGRRRGRAHAARSSATTSGSARRTTSPGWSPIWRRMPQPTSPARPSASAATACSSGRTPSPSSTAYRDGGWIYDALEELRRRVRRAAAVGRREVPAAPGRAPAPARLMRLTTP